MSRILVVEDSEDVQRLVAKALGPDHELRVSGGVEEGLSLLEAESFDLILLDVGLPDGDGFQLCSIAQADERTREIPVVFLTGRGETRDKVLAFSLGADDFVEKPFDPRELRARVEARLRKAGAARPVLRRGSLRVDLTRYRAWRVEGGAEVDLELTPNEFKLLYALMSREDQVLTREQLHASVWGDTVVGPRTIDAHVSNLRKKLGALGETIRSTRGLGYRFVGEGA